MAKTFALSFVLGATLSKEYFSVFDNAKKRVNDLGSTFRSNDKKLQAANGVIKYKERLQMLKQKQEQAGGSNKKLAQGIKVTERLYKQAKASAKSYELEIGNVTKQQRKLSLETDKYQRKLKQLNRAQKMKDGAANKLQNMRGQVLGMAGGAYAGTRVIGQTMTFQHELRMFGNTGDLSDEELKKVRSQLKDVALQVNQDQFELLGGVDFLVGKGLDTSQAVAAIDKVGKTATATGAPLLDLSKAAFAVMDNLNISENELESAFNIMAASGKAGGFELRDMAQYFPQLTAQAKSLGVEGKAGLAMLGSSLQIAMKGAGDPSTAANNFNNFLAKLTAPETVRNFQKMGIDIKQEFQRAMEGGKDPVVEMIRLTELLTDGDKFKIGELFGDMQVINFLNPMLSNLKEFEDIKKKSLNSDGVLDKDFANIMATGTEQTKLFTIALKSIGDGLANSVLPSITPVISGLANVIGWVAKGVEKYPTLGKAIFGVGLGFTAMATGLAIVTAATWAFNTALLANPITWVVGGLILGASLLIAFWKPVKTFFGGLWTGITQGLSPVIDAFKPLKVVFEPIVDAFSDVVGWLGEMFPAFAETSEGLEGIASTGEMVGKVIGKGLSFALTPLTILIKSVSWLGAFFSSAWSEIKTAFDGGLTGVGALILNWSPLGLFYKAFSGVLSWFDVELPETFTGFGSKMIGALMDGIQMLLPDVGGMLNSIPMPDWVKSKLGFKTDEFQTALDVNPEINPQAASPKKLLPDVGNLFSNISMSDWAKSVLGFAPTEMPSQGLDVKYIQPEPKRVQAALRGQPQMQNNIEVTVNNPASTVEVEQAITNAMGRQFAVPLTDMDY